MNIYKEINRILSSVLLLVTFIGSNSLLAEFGPQPEVYWGKSSNSKFECKVETRIGLVTVFKTGKRDKPLWEANVPSYHKYFSSVKLADSGDYILHVRKNHIVNSLKDIAVELINKQGRKATLKAEKFIDKLIEPPQNISIAPRNIWLQSIKEVHSDFFTVVNAKNQERKIFLKDLKMENWTEKKKLHEGDLKKILPEADIIKSVVIGFADPKRGKVKFAATLNDWKNIRAELIHAEDSPTVTKWEEFGLIELTLRDNTVFKIKLHDFGSFQISEKDFSSHDSKDLMRVLHEAYFASIEKQMKEKKALPSK